MVVWWKWVEEVKRIWESWNLDFETQPSTTLDQNSFPKFHQNLFIPSKPRNSSLISSSKPHKQQQAQAPHRLMFSGGGAVIAVVDLMDWIEPPDLREQVLLHEESASQGLGSGRSAPSVPGGAQSAWAHFTARLHHQAHGSTQIRIRSVEDAMLLMVKTHGSTPPQIRIQAKEEKEALQRGWSLAED